MAEDLGHLLESRGEFGVTRAFFHGEMRKRGGGFGVVVVKEETAAVLRRSEEARFWLNNLEIEILELKTIHEG